MAIQDIFSVRKKQIKRDTIADILTSDEEIPSISQPPEGRNDGASLLDKFDGNIPFSNPTPFFEQPSDDEPEENGSSNRSATQALQDAQGNVIDTLEDQKQDPDQFILPEPEKPERDTEAIERNDRLNKINLISSLVNAGVNIIGNDGLEGPVIDFDNGQLGGQLLNNLQNRDAQFRTELERFNQNLFSTEQQNQQIRNQVANRNDQIDLNIAQQRLQNAQHRAEIERKVGNEIDRQELQDDKDLREAAFRLLSDGQPDAGLVMLEQTGLSTEEARKALRTRQRSGSGGGSGTGEEDSSISPTLLNKARVVKKLQKVVDKQQKNASSPAEQPYDNEGNPRSKEARRLESYLDDKEVNNAIHNPDVRKEIGLEPLGGNDNENDSNNEPLLDIDPQQQNTETQQNPVEQINQVIDVEDPILRNQTIQDAAGKLDNQGLKQTFNSLKAKYNSTTNLNERGRVIDVATEIMSAKGLSRPEMIKVRTEFFGAESDSQGNTQRNTRTSQVGLSGRFNSSAISTTDQPDQPDETEIERDINEAASRIEELESKDVDDVSIQEFKELQNLKFGILRNLKLRERSFTSDAAPNTDDIKERFGGIISNIKQNASSLVDAIVESDKEAFERFKNNN